MSAEHAIQDSVSSGTVPLRSLLWIDRLDVLLENRSREIALGIVIAGLLWRLWLSDATFFNTDEAWHFSLANVGSLRQAYKTSLTISHPPLLILIVHFWRQLGTSNVVLRLPVVLAGTAFCWIFYRWLNLVAGRAAAWPGLVLATFLSPMISTSAELRQNPLLLVFAISAMYLLELAFQQSSVLAMCGSSVCLCLAMLSHYSAFFVAAALGVYSIIRIWRQRPRIALIVAWVTGQCLALAVAALLYKTHLGILNQLLDQALLPQHYLSNSYFHHGKDQLLPFVYRGTFGVFRFVFGQTQIGQLAAVLFGVGVVLLLVNKSSRSSPHGRALGILLVLPFLLNWIAAAAGLYPYGRMRQCMFLAGFALAGVCIFLGSMARNRPVVATVLAVGVVVLCHGFGTQQDRDELPVSEQRHEHMDSMIDSIRTNVGAGDLIFTDQATSYQLRHYLCDQKPVSIDRTSVDFQSFRCEGFHVVIARPDEGALTAQSVDARWRNADGRLDLSTTANHVWVVQGGWASGLGEQLKQLPSFAHLEIHSYGRYLEFFELPQRKPRPGQG